MVLKHVRFGKLDAGQIKVGLCKGRFARLAYVSQPATFDVLARDRKVTFTINIVPDAVADAWIVEIDQEKILRLLLNVLRCANL